MADKITGLAGGLRKAVTGLTDILGKETPSVMSKVQGVAEGPAAQYLSKLQPIVELKAKPIEPIPPRSQYETKQEGSFFRVRPESARSSTATPRGILEEVQPPAGAGSGSTGYAVPQRLSSTQIRETIKDPQNFVQRAANEYAQKTTGAPYELPKIPESSLAKQSAIGRTFQLAAGDDPAYKKTVFDAYAAKYPDLVEQSGATNYDQLLESAYRQLAKETESQFRTLPVNMSYHRGGEGTYKNSQEMLQDVYGNRHLYVYQGGDPHDFLNAVDPATGLNTNEMFRAVHDFYGHAIHGNTFGPKGEEIAWAAHSRMFSPLARLAMTAETRGQNSFVNYTPLNAELKALISQTDKELARARNAKDEKGVRELEEQKNALWQEFQFAPQKSILLPPEYLDLNYKGGMPSYIQPLIKPQAGTTTTEQLTHFSHQPGLEFIDPARYGTGIKGAEMERLRYTLNPVTERAYFYSGDPTKVQAEPGLGIHRYGTQSESLYDVSKDPLKFRALAEESYRFPYTGNINPGATDRPQAQTDVERMIKEYGYEGMLSPNQGMAITFGKTPVKKFAKGGKVEGVRYPRVKYPALEAMQYGTPMRQDYVSAREPSARELLAEKLQSQLEKILPEKTAKSAARKVTGYGYPMGLIDVTPAGIPLWAYEGGQSLAKAAEAAGEGRYGTAAFEGALGALGLAPAAKPAAAGAKAVGKQAAKAIDRAMMTGEGPLGAALAAVRPQFIFVGPKSATWDAQAANRAQELEKAGKSPSEIWKETKTFRGADGNWRQEISDLGSQFLTAEGLQAKAKAMRAAEEELKQRVAQSKEYPDLFPKQLAEAQKLARKQIKESKSAREGVHGVEFDTNWRGNFAQYVLEHPELYEAYPHLKEAVIKQGESGPYQGLMTAGSPTDVEISIYKKGLQDDPRSTALHEMQHAIQTYEGWAPGGNAAMAFRDPKAFEILDELRQKALKPMSLDEYKEAYSGVFASDATLKQEYNKYKKSLPDFVKNLDRDLQQTAAFEYYKRLAGEAEARATQKRAPLSEVGRALIPPEQSFDVPFERQIIKERDFPTAEDPIQAAALAYHGSPHQFEKFDLSKIGTGEGAQAYGHGLYFAESPEVAESYQRMAGVKLTDKKGNEIPVPPEVEWVAKDLAAAGGDYNKVREDLIEHGKTWPWPAEMGLRRLDEWERAEIVPQTQGSLYKVDIPDEAVARMLDWDKPLKEQKHLFENVGPHGGEFKFKDLMERIGFDPQGTGGELLQEMGSGRSPEKAAAISNTLREYGIPGIKYLDQGSRGTGEGTRNFVLFSEDLPRILEVNEKPTGAKPWAPGEWGREPYPQAEALETARKNAVEMLGLPENNTAMDRARAMGFDTPAYHSTQADFAAFNIPEYRGAAFFAGTPQKSEAGAKAGAGDVPGAREGAQQIMPVMLRSEDVMGLQMPPNQKKWFESLPPTLSEQELLGIQNSSMPQGTYWFNWFDEIQTPDNKFLYVKKPAPSLSYEAAASEGKNYLGQPISNYDAASAERWAAQNAQEQGMKGFMQRDEAGVSIGMTDPSRIRSRFAAFDPARMNENDLLGYANLGILPYVGGLGALGALGLSQIEEKPKKKGTKNGK